MYSIRVFCLAIFCASSMAAGAAGPESFTIETSDGIQVHGDFYQADQGLSAPVVLLFHQGRANARGEYSYLAGELTLRGYNVIAIDQRRGGDLFDEQNRTLAALDGRGFQYCEVYPDLEATLKYADELGLTGKRVVMGSSYSAALVIKLANENPQKIDAVVAFSPASGEPMEGCQPDAYFDSIQTPLLVLRPGREMEIESVQTQLERAADAGHLTFVAENGVHGSSMLHPERVEGSVRAQQKVVFDFIEKHTKPIVPGPSFEQVISLRSAGSPAVSPDGRSVAFTVQTVDWEKNRYDSEVWVAVDGGEPVQFTRTSDGSSNNPQWSPDGKWLTFAADRGEKRQVYAMRVQGGEAQQVTHAPEGVNGYAWSPTENKIAYTMTAPQDSAAKVREEQYGAFAVEDAEYRITHVWVVDVDVDATPASEVYCADDKDACVKPPEPRQLTESDTMTVTSFSWRPDGQAISIEHQESSDIMSFMTSDISLIDLESGDLRPLVRSEGYDGNVVWSPDSEWILYESDAGNTRSNFFRNDRYMLISADGGTPRELFVEFDENLAGYRWTPGGLFALAWQKTERGLFRLDVEEDEVVRLENAPRNVWSIDFSKDGSIGYMLSQTPTTLSEISQFSTTDLQRTQVTSMTEQIADWEVGTSEVISWTSEDGAEIEGVLFKPSDFDPDKKHPLLVVIHGGPTGIDYPTPIDSYVYPIPQWLSKGAVVLQPNYRGSAGYGEAFRSLNVRNLGVGDAWDVMSGVDHLIAQGFVDESKMGAMGWSQGGYISAFLTTNTDRFAGISVGAGISNWVTYYVNTDIHPFTRQYLESTPWEDMDIYLKTSPMTNITKATTPTLIQHGEFDRRVPIPNAYELFQGLQDNDVETKLIVYKGFGHGINKPKERLAATWHNWEWFARYIWGEEAAME